MWDIAQALGSPTIFVRYNPDPYRDSEGQRADPALSVREAALISWLKTLQVREPAHTGSAAAIYLYYDGFARPEDIAEEALPDPFAEYQAPPSTLTDADIDELMAGLTLE
jgi:hypothetical protein